MVCTRKKTNHANTVYHRLFFTKVKFYIILLDDVELCTGCSDIITLRHRRIGYTQKFLVLTDMRSILSLSLTFEVPASGHIP